ncbi:GreA/GreB family elongation factor [Patescibacteria group bacterium]|nr:GreA/GreB family elongation factor [Patescibacteria group bacterium]
MRIPYILFTSSGLEKIKKEKEELLLRRPTAVENLRIAREMGDLSENGAYKAARAELSSLDSRLRHLNYLLCVGRVQTAPIVKGRIGIGSKVKLSDGKKEMEYEIVGSFESDPSQGRISHISPLGKSLMGKGQGENVTMQTPDSVVNYKVLQIL